MAARAGDAAIRQRLQRSRRKRSQRGIALLMVLSTLTVLTVMLTEFQDSTSAEMGSSASARDQVKAEYAARSAVNLTRLLIAAEPTVRTALAPLFLGSKGGAPQIPVWEFTDIILGAFGDESGQELFSSMSGLDLTDSRNLGMEGAHFEIVVIDEDSKINLNVAARADGFSQQRMAEQIISLVGSPQYDELFQELDEEGDLHDRQTVCGAIIDWADPNQDRSPCDPSAETASTAGAEDSYYEMLKRPYKRKNAAFDSLEELRLVRGIDDRFWRTFVHPDPDDPKSRVLTVWGAGPVNVNSANPQTLLAMALHKAKPESALRTDPEQQATLLSVLYMLKGMQGGIPVFTSPKAFINAIQGKGSIGGMMTTLGLTPVELLSEAEVEKAITVESSVFSIHATGVVKAGKRRTRTQVTAVVDFRGAPPPGTAEQFTKYQQLRDAGLMSAGVDTEGDDAGTNPLLLPSPGGSVIYYRVD